MQQEQFDPSSLTPTERLDLIERLWDSFSATPETLPVTQAQRDELDRRIEAQDAGLVENIPIDEVLEGIRSRARGKVQSQS